ncbi:MAG: amino acid kinase family protein [Vulcanimicrobiaceae bacterium]
MIATEQFKGATFVVRVDDATARSADATLIDDLHFLAEHQIHPVVVAPSPRAAHAIVRTINRSTDIAVSLRGADAAMLPKTAAGIGRVQTRILRTLLDQGFIPVVEPTAFAAFSRDDPRVIADDVASAIAGALEATRALFFHRAGGVIDPKTHAMIGELTPAEALDLAEDETLPAGLRATMRAAALGVRNGVPAAQIVDGRLAHAAIVELITAHHLGTQVTGGIVFAA